MINMFNKDCMEGMGYTPDNYYDLSIVDPPYNINLNINAGKRKNKRGRYDESKNWDNVILKDNYFLELKRTSKNQIIFGCNYYNRITELFGPGRVFWYKVNGLNNDFSDGELIACTKTKKIIYYKHQWSGALRDSERGINRIHPTQKPVQIYKWLLHNYAKEGDKILDTHGGSGSICIACHDMGFDLDWYEIDEDYYKDAKKRFEVQRFEVHTSQLQLKF